MTIPPFPQNVIAVIWDFDKTLIPEYMQKPLFKRFSVDEMQFWKEVNALPGFYRDRGHPLVSPDTIYLSHILTYVRAEKFKSLNNHVLREVGSELKLYPGMPDFLSRLKQRLEENEQFKKHEIKVEHYVVSTGLRQTILGSPIAKEVDEVWACEFLETTAPPGFLASEGIEQAEPLLQDVGYVIDNTTKTRAVFEINKGVNKHPAEISVNDSMAPEHRRVPISNMVYIADGPSDIPVFSILNQYGGKTFAVYNPDSEREFRQVTDLQEQRRVQGIGPADYQDGTHTARWLSYAVERIAKEIQSRREQALGDSVGKPPEHFIEEPPVEAPQDAVAQTTPGGSPEPDSSVAGSNTSTDAPPG